MILSGDRGLREYIRTFINTEPLLPHCRKQIGDGDIIILGTGNMSARFLFITE
jgi:hypothetical protein